MLEIQKTLRKGQRPFLALAAFEKAAKAECPKIEDNGKAIIFNNFLGGLGL